MKKEYLSPTVEQTPVMVEQPICSSSFQSFQSKEDFFDADSD